MVKKVLEWRKANRKEADILWASLQNNNERLRQELKRQAQHPDAAGDFSDIRTLLERTRQHIRTMTRRTGVPIEPSVQTELLDSISELEGVIGGVVPGAGGYDAIAILIRDDPTVVSRLREHLASWTSTVEDDFGGKIGNVRLLGVQHGSEGAKNEMLEQYAGWV
jgi:phosphomevalonate kinase